MISNTTDMRRRIKQHYQLQIIGGGIYGAALAWEAAHRGIDTLLLEAGDFASGTSGNSLKLIHGGIRYLQQFDLARTRKSANERRAFFRIAPHLVQPLACTLATGKKLSSGRLAVASGMTLYNLLSADRNNGVSHGHHISGAKLVLHPDLEKQLPPLAQPGVNGGALWHDGQAWHTERLALAFLRAAANLGATVHNYLEATELKISNGITNGICVTDHISGASFNIGSDTVIDCSSGSQFLGQHGPDANSTIHYARGVNLVIKRRLLEHGAGVRAQMPGAHNRLLFLTPWRDISLAGTWYLPWRGGDMDISESELGACIAELNSAFQQDLITRDDIVDLHIGVLPLSQRVNSSDIDNQLMKRNQCIDLGPSGASGAYIVRGTKYTMARATAQDTVTRLAHKHQWSIEKSQSAILAIDGGDIQEMDIELGNLRRYTQSRLSDSALTQLLYHFGSNAIAVLKLDTQKDASYELIPGTDMPASAIDYAVANEWTHSLEDLLLRRLELRVAGRFNPETLEFCCARLARLLRWNKMEFSRQLSLLQQKNIKFERSSSKAILATA